MSVVIIYIYIVSIYEKMTRRPRFFLRLRVRVLGPFTFTGEVLLELEAR